MRRLLLSLIILVGSVTFHESFAVQTTALPDGNIQTGPQITVNDFLSFDFKNYRTAEGKKLSWAKRMSGQIMQKNLARQVKKGKIEGTANFQEAARASAANKTGRLALIFSALGIVFLFIPYLSIVGFGLSVAGFVLGIIGLGKDEDTTMALLGLVIGAVGLFLYLLVVLVAVSWFSWF